MNFLMGELVLGSAFECASWQVLEYKEEEKEIFLQQFNISKRDLENKMFLLS